MPCNPLAQQYRTVLAAGLALALAAPMLGSVSPAPSPRPSTGGPYADVVVSGLPGSYAAVERAVVAAGGTVRDHLRIINGVAARVPAAAEQALRHAPGVRAVTSDSSGHLMSVDPSLGYDVSNDAGSLYDIAQVTHAQDAWSHGWTGKGIDVALIDSGVSPVPGLTSGNVIDGPDLSFESQDPSLTHLDTFGHGTHMASIIVGRDKASTGSNYASASSHQYYGIAPDSRLVSVKVASNDGAADVSQVIAAIDWVTEHAHAGGLNIRVLNLSYGTDSTQDPSVDPLCYAVEMAWRAGIVVVVSSGNDGTARQSLADPAIDPLVLAVGADDTQASDSISDDQVPTFAQRGTSKRHVDLIVPGVHVLGLRDPGSRIDLENPSAVVSKRFFRGSGTSQSAAVASGLAALYLSRYPTATPDQVKRALMTNSTQPSSVKPLFSGVGVPDVNKAIGTRLPSYAQLATNATGTGSLEAARGSAHVSDGTTTLTGEQDIFGNAWDGASWAALSANGYAWTGGDWNGSTWTGSDWTAGGWTGHTWTGHTWTGHTWTGVSWAGHTWTGHTWTGSGWDGHTWTNSGWAGATWQGSTWADASWS
ncbi:MAG: S8 family serine peptidase [Frankiaceae bacterium]